MTGRFSGRVLACQVLWFVERIGRESGARNRPLVEWAQQRKREVEEGGWLPDRAPRAAKAIAETTRNVVSVMLPELVAEALRLGRAQPRLTNMDGDPLELIEARLQVTERDSARRALLAHADFEADEEQITWYGDEMPEATRRDVLERVQAEGGDLADVPDGPHSAGFAAPFTSRAATCGSRSTRAAAWSACWRCLPSSVTRPASRRSRSATWARGLTRSCRHHWQDHGLPYRPTSRSRCSTG